MLGQGTGAGPPESWGSSQRGAIRFPGRGARHAPPGPSPLRWSSVSCQPLKGPAAPAARSSQSWLGCKERPVAARYLGRAPQPRGAPHTHSWAGCPGPALQPRAGLSDTPNSERPRWCPWSPRERVQEIPSQSGGLLNPPDGTCHLLGGGDLRSLPELPFPSVDVSAGVSPQRWSLGWDALAFRGLLAGGHCGLRHPERCLCGEQVLRAALLGAGCLLSV